MTPYSNIRFENYKKKYEWIFTKMANGSNYSGVCVCLFNFRKYLVFTPLSLLVNPFIHFYSVFPYYYIPKFLTNNKGCRLISYFL